MLSPRIRNLVAASLVLASTAASSSTVIVRPGDTLSSIAAREGVTVDRLVEANSIDDPDLIYPGQRLVSGTHDDASAGRTHVVQRGETVASIAAAHGVEPEALARRNGIVNGEVLFGVSLLLDSDLVGFVPGDMQSHIVSRGETLESIAQSHETTVHRLRHVNDLGTREPIAGRVLQVPNGPWLCPISVSRFVNDWRIVKPDGRIHEGVDVFADRGSAIHAPVAGYVEQTEGPRSGHAFTLTADDGTVYYGAHMDEPGASGRVEAGAELGTVGTSGNAAGTSPHLHFAIHTAEGQSVNPYPSLARSCS